jgi:hypothetical protein
VPNAICRKDAALVRGIAPFAKDSSTCACVPTVCTTARIAGKPARSRSRRAVATEPNSLHMQLDADTRLAAAAGGVARFLADAAGMESSAIVQLQSAVVAACAATFKHLTVKHAHLEITFARYSDRIEVALSHEGDASRAFGFDATAGFAARGAGETASPGTFAGVDRVQYETHGAEIVTRLTKYLGKVAPKI